MEGVRSGGDDVSISGLDLNDTRYTVEQGALFSSRYEATDSRGNTVLRGKKKHFKLREEFVFRDARDTEVFRVKAGSALDVAGNYAMIDSRTDRTVAVLDNDFSLFQDTWRVRHGGTDRILAQFEGGGLRSSLARSIGGEFLIPHSYEIIDADGRHVGRIQGKRSLFRDRYDVVIDDASGLAGEVVVAAAMVIDAIQDL